MANLLDTLQEEGTFTTFTRAINTTGIVATLREPGAYIFRFSPRQGTAAARAARMKGQIKEEVKKARRSGC
jgi:tRNA A37 methylthiotransferase MiaB